MKVLSAVILLASVAVAVVRSAPLFSTPYHPIVIWHGLGDSAYAEGMKSLADELREAFPGIYVHLIALAGDLSSDQKAGFFGNVNGQVDQVCDSLTEIPELTNGFDAIGFSQGGQFLRAYVERCNVPKVRNLVTFGSQHQGIADLPACKPGDFFCRLAEGALRGGIYTDYAQNNLITAQYFRDPRAFETLKKYFEANRFLTDINNELQYNETYKRNLESLESFVMLMFDKDVTVEPKQSSWFATYPDTQQEEEEEEEEEEREFTSSSKDQLEVVPLRQSQIYTEDRIGLKTLDKRGALKMDLCKGVHMQIDSACQMKIFGKYAGIAPPSSFIATPLRHGWARFVYSITGLRTQEMPTSLQACLVLIFLLTVRLVWLSSNLLMRTRRGGIRL